MNYHTSIRRTIFYSLRICVFVNEIQIYTACFGMYFFLLFLMTGYFLYRTPLIHVLESSLELSALHQIHHDYLRFFRLIKVTKTVLDFDTVLQ